MSSMGADMGDINNDGYPDIFTTDMLPDDDYRLKTTTSFETIDVLKLKENFLRSFQLLRRRQPTTRIYHHL